MYAGRFFLGLVFLVLAALPAQAADLARIEPVVGKEPKYQGAVSSCSGWLTVVDPRSR
jgi:hypothetical protein